jgi:hypothetical protein
MDTLITCHCSSCIPLYQAPCEHCKKEKILITAEEVLNLMKRVEALEKRNEMLAISFDIGSIAIEPFSTTEK